MIKDARHARVPQRFRDGFDAFARGAINDAGFVIADQRMKSRILFGFVGDLSHHQFQIGARETGDEFARLAQIKMREDIAPHIGSCRGGECGHLRAAEFFQDDVEPKIIRPEIVAPHGKTMRFIHREKRDRRLAQRIDEVATAKTFRRDVNEFEITAGESANALLLLRPGE